MFGALARGDLEAALRDLLGEAEWDKLAPGFTLGRLDLLFTAIAAEAGFDLKNSGRRSSAFDPGGRDAAMTAAYGGQRTDPLLIGMACAACCCTICLPARMTWASTGQLRAQMLAALLDYIAYLTWVTLRAHGAKSAPRPRPVQRPPRRGSTARAGGVSTTTNALR